MSGKCANPPCSAVLHSGEGKMFRIDVEIGNKSGGTQEKTAYVWLCKHCASQLNPRVEVAGDRVRVLLGAIHAHPPLTRPMGATVN